MKQIPSAKEFLKNNANDISYEEGFMFAADVTPEMLIQFAKLHVNAALEAAAENVDMKKECGCKTESECYAVLCCDTVIDKDSILNAYPENLIQ